MKKLIQVSAVQTHWAKDLHHNLDTSMNRIKEAKKLGSDIILFPEASLTSFDYDYAINLRHEEVVSALDAIRKVAKEKKVNVIVGSIQRRGSKKRFLNITHVIDRQGNVIYEYAKVHLAGEDEKKYCRGGNKIAFFELEGINCTLTICRDGRHPELFVIPAMTGAQIYFQPSSSTDTIEKSWWKKQTGRAQQLAGPITFIYHAMANTVGQNRVGSLVSLGGSFIKDPTGLSLAEAGCFEETMITARFDVSKASRRYALDSLKTPKILSKEWEKIVNIMMHHKDDEVV